MQAASALECKQVSLRPSSGPGVCSLGGPGTSSSKLPELPRAESPYSPGVGSHCVQGSLHHFSQTSGLTIIVGRPGIHVNSLGIMFQSIYSARSLPESISWGTLSSNSNVKQISGLLPFRRESFSWPQARLHALHASACPCWHIEILQVECDSQAVTYSLERDLEKRTTNWAVHSVTGSHSHGCSPTYLPAEGQEFQWGPDRFYWVTVTDLQMPYSVEKETRMELGRTIKLSRIRRTRFLSCIVGEILTFSMLWSGLMAPSKNSRLLYPVSHLPAKSCPPITLHQIVSRDTKPL